MPDSEVSMGRRESDKGALLWKILGGALGIMFTVLFSRFVDTYTKQAETQSKILSSLGSIEIKMEMVNFPTLRKDIDSLEARAAYFERELTNLKREIESVKYGKFNENSEK